MSEIFVSDHLPVPSPAVASIHAQVPGRARLQVSGLRRDPELKELLEAWLPAHQAVRSVSASITTGNILVYYGPEVDLPEIIGVIEVILRTPREDAPGTVSPRDGNRLIPDAWAARVRNGIRPQPAEPAHRTKSLRTLIGLHKAPPEPAQPWHVLTVEEATAFWRTNATAGLTGEAASSALRAYGPNALPTREPRRALELLREQLSGLPVLLLLGAAALSIATGGLADAVVITAVVALNASIGVATELKAEKTIRALLDVPEPDALVLRDGVRQRVPTDNVVPGDLLLLRPGERVAADARLLAATDLSVDESALTGESMPVEKSVEALPAAAVLAERRNMVYRGTAVTGGGGRAVVVATGAATEIGRVQQLMAETDQPMTPLQRQMERLGTQMLWLSGGVTVLVFVAGLLRGQSVLEMARSAISLAIAAVPEGLPTVATVALAKGMRALEAQRILVRRLEAVETLGSVQVVCFDKTGTLTLNRMSAAAAHAGMQHVRLDDGAAADPSPEFRKLSEIAALCNEADYSGENGTRAFTGSATETALLRMALDNGVDVAALRQAFPVVRKIHRAHGRTYMITVHRAGEGRELLAVKGSPAEVLALCDTHRLGEAVQQLSDQDRSGILAENERMAKGALRVLGVACREVAAGGKHARPHNLVWQGLVGIADPPRQGLRELLAAFRRAGIRPVMLTGDQTATARAIAAELHLNGGGALDVVPSTDLDVLPPEQWPAVAHQAHIFARVNPAHKLQIVQALQQGGDVVAMTGDGINDGPALKAADVGIALGQGGTDVARGVADVVLADDDVGRLLAAVREGRTVYEDLRKAVHYISATNASEMLVMLAALAGGLGQPLNPRQLLWINLMTDVFPELALAMERPPADILDRPPRDPRQPVIGRTDYGRLGRQAGFLSAAGLGAYLYGLARYGAGPQASTLAFLTLTSAQLLHAFSARSDDRSAISRELPPNPYLSMGVMGGFGMLLLSQFIPGLGGLLGTSRIGIGDALVALAAALGSLVANEASKAAPKLLPAPATDYPFIEQQHARRERP